ADRVGLHRPLAGLAGHRDVVDRQHQELRPLAVLGGGARLRLRRPRDLGRQVVVVLHRLLALRGVLGPDRDRLVDRGRPRLGERRVELPGRHDRRLVLPRVPLLLLLLLRLVLLEILLVLLLLLGLLLVVALLLVVG